MEPYYLSQEEFWDWFNRDPSADQQILAESTALSKSHIPVIGRLSNQSNQVQHIKSNTPQASMTSYKDDVQDFKRMRLGPDQKKPIRHIVETEAAVRCDSRYVIMYGKHRPGKKSKVWEGDGYLSLLNGIAHLSDLKGRILEEPTVLDDVDMEAVHGMSELLIGSTEVQVVERDL